MKIALVHDYLAQDGGAERVLKAMHEIWPEAPIFVLFHNKKKITSFPDKNIKETFLARLPFGRTSYQWYLPWMPVATESQDLNGFDVVISTSSVFAKGVITPPGTLHISYCHTPPRFLWADHREYISDLRQNGLIKLFLPGMVHNLRIWDKMSVDRVDYFIANSKTVQQRIHKYYRRESEVIYPPVDTQNFKIQPNIGDYFVAGGRLVPYKRTDLIVKAFNRLRWPLKIFGTGPELSTLKKIAKPNIEFLEQISETAKADLLSRAKAYIHPQLEDFGITAIESMASGRPVIAYCQGGATETVISNETGKFFHSQSWESLLDALLNFNFENWDSAKIREHALKFDVNNFKNNFKKKINDRHEEFKKGMNQEVLIK
ncbi:MAG: glycosyltransferase [Patescibacteria group bacterium]